MGEVERDRDGELEYWSAQKESEGDLRNTWFEGFYASHFGLTRGDYTDKRVLDIGCGPRGSLEWATTAAERVGVDPLADDYLALGAADHAMTYVAAPAERKGGGLYASIEEGVPFDHSDARRRYGILSARFVRTAPAPPKPSVFRRALNRVARILGR